MLDFVDILSHFKDQVVFLIHHPEFVKAQLMNNHTLLVEIIGVIVLLCLLLAALFKSAPAVETPLQQDTTTKAHKKNLPPEISTSIKTQPTSNSKPSHETKAWIKRAPPSIHELSNEEEQALNQAIAIAGKQALAEVTGEPVQAEFFQNSEVTDAAKKMFARQREVPSAESSTAVSPSKLEFVILYFMAPRSQHFELSSLFQILREMELSLNDHHVFECHEAGTLQFYVTSALKPGRFDVHSLNASVPGLSFVLDLTQVADGKTAFNRMLELIHRLSQKLKGDILDEYRQRLTQTTISAYMTRIKSFSQDRNL